MTTDFKTDIWKFTPFAHQVIYDGDEPLTSLIIQRLIQQLVDWESQKCTISSEGLNALHTQPCPSWEWCYINCKSWVVFFLCFFFFLNCGFYDSIFNWDVHMFVQGFSLMPRANCRRWKYCRSNYNYMFTNSSFMQRPSCGIQPHLTQWCTCSRKNYSCSIQFQASTLECFAQTQNHIHHWAHLP